MQHRWLLDAAAELRGPGLPARMNRPGTFSARIQRAAGRLRGGGARLVGERARLWLRCVIDNLAWVTGWL